MEYRGLLVLNTFALVCFAVSSGSPIEPEEVEPMKHKPRLCDIHNDCMCYDGLPFCHGKECYCLMGGHFVETGDGLPEITTELVDNSKE